MAYEYADRLLNQLADLREKRFDCIDKGEHAKAEALQGAISALYESYASMVGELD